MRGGQAEGHAGERASGDARGKRGASQMRLHWSTPVRFPGVHAQGGWGALSFLGFPGNPGVGNGRETPPWARQGTVFFEAIAKKKWGFVSPMRNGSAFLVRVEDS